MKEGLREDKKEKKNIAVILAGCGNRDGAEITESVATLVSLSEFGAQAHCFAPSIEFKPKNFLTNEELPEKRNVLVEAARIARGEIQDLKVLLSQLRSQAFFYDGIILPGGWGAALHLCDWAEKGAQCQVLPELKEVLEDFFHRGKPIGAICIAPVILARVLGFHQILITLGEESESSAALVKEVLKTGAIHKPCVSSSYIVDSKNRIITSPAYMCSAPSHEIFQGIRGLVKTLVGELV